MQTHGAIGFTQEHDLSLWLLRVQALRSAWGTTAKHIARRVLGGVDDGRTENCCATPSPLWSTKHASPAAVRAAMESDRGYDESLWQLLCEQVGAAALVVPEELGGAGGELADAAIGFAGAGPRAGALPAAGHHAGGTGAAGRARTGRRDAGTPGRGQLDRRAGARSRATWSTAISPTSSSPPTEGQLSRWTRFSARPVATMDPTRRLARVQPEETEAIGADPGLADTAAILLAAEQIGAAERCLDLTVEYTKNRVQFGRPIGSFQALKHRMADLYVAVAAARAVVSDACDDPTPTNAATGAPGRQRGAVHRGGRGHPAARRHRDHLGTRHAPVFQTRARQCATARLAARAVAPTGIRSLSRRHRERPPWHCAPASRRSM